MAWMVVRRWDRKLVGSNIERAGVYASRDVFDKPSNLSGRAVEDLPRGSTIASRSEMRNTYLGLRPRNALWFLTA